ncbi:hypothetical protein TNCV_2937571 [Trichonephila clavipes]|nr:hypothetical protein TNCV_2937571 [Trichonephila clavipes]
MVPCNRTYHFLSRNRDLFRFHLPRRRQSFLPRPLYGRQQRTRKGLTYHMLRYHGVSVGKSRRKKKRKEASVDPSRSPTSPPAQENLQRNHTQGEQIQATSEEVTESTQNTGVVLLGNTLRLTFPLPTLLTCPAAGCTAPFTTEK